MIVDPNMTLLEFARDYLCRKDARTAKQVVIRDHIPHTVDGCHWLIKKSDAETWRHRHTQVPARRNLKTLLNEISEKVLREQKDGAA